MSIQITFLLLRFARFNPFWIDGCELNSFRYDPSRHAALKPRAIVAASSSWLGDA
ncbi:hypothetical protein PQR01_01925 [Paraburkholderia rhynchosiae]|uniref:Uncharacterized protein n=1 Tax=Paraburkholderia rhynchosiae TaxID=487049 RepID=A0ACC7N3X7_9BURK